MPKKKSTAVKDSVGNDVAAAIPDEAVENLLKAMESLNNPELVKRDILMLVCTRNVLKELVSTCSGLERADVTRLLPRLITELQQLQAGCLKSVAWGQVTKGLSGTQQYGLQRIGLYPSSEE